MAQIPQPARRQPKVVKNLANILLISLSVLFLADHFFYSARSHNRFTFLLLVPRVIDENGVVSDLILSSGEAETAERDGNAEVRVSKMFHTCERNKTDFVPCLDNADEIKKLNFERHCPDRDQALRCVVPSPEGYRIRIPWPQSRDEVWLSNLPRTRSVAVKGDKYVFRRDGPDEYLDRISKIVPEIAFGRITKVALDIGSGVASFGAFLMQRNVTTLSIAPKDVRGNQIQFAMERGVPAMLATFSTRRLLYPSQAFDLIHCSRCKIDWTRDDGILLLEVNRLLRAGGYFVWSPQYFYRRDESQHKQWIEMKDLSLRICWELVKKEENIAIWKKPINNHCYNNRDIRVQPPLCDSGDDPDNVWYVDMKKCITPLPENGFGSNLTTWPERLQTPPDRVQNITTDSLISLKLLFTVEANDRREMLNDYTQTPHWRESKFRNVLDMNAIFGGFAAALYEHGYDCWVMNVVPASRLNTLPVIYDRGLIGVMHDWCEPFDTYPRTYDLINAAELFSFEKERCNITDILLEVDRILRPGGHVYIHDQVSVLDEINEIARSIGWVSSIHDTEEEDPYGKILIGKKLL